MAEKTEAVIKPSKKKKQTVMVPHLFEIVSEDKTAGTVTLKKVALPRESKRGNTRSEKIQNGMLEASDNGDTTYSGKAFTILYSNMEEFLVFAKSVSVAQKRA